MTDNSRPEKDALKKTWPTAEQLLCQFHVLQAEWRWLTATANKVPKEDRRQLMAAFQKILYAKDLSQLQAAKEHLRTVGHEAYIHRVEAFLCCKKEWVQMYRTNLATRGHNTNNYSEASIRILKDVVLCRTKAFNAVALVEIVVSTWEKYFETRLLRHAHHREASHRLTFEHLLQDLPELPAGSITKSGETYYVPSSSSTATHEVQADVGICSCWVGASMPTLKEKPYTRKRSSLETKTIFEDVGSRTGSQPLAAREVASLERCSGACTPHTCVDTCGRAVPANVCVSCAGQCTEATSEVQAGGCDSTRTKDNVPCLMDRL
ncbi:hypothetical protein HPB49_012416 [Dermacentor silvarum]|uniref:Uncharacterized protein n=1 Tax=Dermacentor silvarum TaxID=543639 RepID=A0ACB8CX60_DERSI|nr:hypothetical protein HPB49_012416 [Dermacentor silvarum]